MNEIRQWFYDLQHRERMLVIAAAITVVIGLFYFAIWHPLQNKLESSRAVVERQQDLLVWMEESAQTIRQSKQAGASNRAAQPLMQLVNRSARRRGFNLARVQPKGTDEVQLWLDEVAFDEFVQWLGELSQQGANADTITISDVDKPGIVKVNFKLVR